MTVPRLTALIITIAVLAGFSIGDGFGSTERRVVPTASVGASPDTHVGSVAAHQSLGIAQSATRSIDSLLRIFFM